MTGPAYLLTALFLGAALLLPLPSLADSDRLQRSAELRDSEPARALELAREELEAAQDSGNESLAARARLALAHALEVLGGHDEALILLDAAETVFAREREQELLAEALKLRGAILYYQGRNDLALNAFQRAYDIHQREGNLSGLAEALNRMGRVHDSQGNPQRALEYYRQSYEQQEQAGNLDGMATQLNNMATIERQQGNVDAALEAYERSITLRERTGNLRDMAGTYSNIGVLYYFEGNHTQALEWMDRAIALQEQIGDQPGVARSQYNIGRILEGLERTDEAIERFETSLPIALENNNLNLLRLIYTRLSEINADRGNYQRALEFSRMATDARTEMFDVERQRQIEAMNARFETSRKEREIALLQEQRRFDSLVRNTAMGGSLLMLILIAVTYNRYRIKLRANQTIQKKNEELSTLDSIVAAINSQEDFRDVLAILLKRTVGFFHNADKGTVLVMEPGTRRFQVAGAYGVLAAEIDDHELDYETVLDMYTHGGEEIGDGIFLHDPARPIGRTSMTEGDSELVSLVAMTIMIDRQIEGFLILTNNPGDPPFRPADAPRFARIREHAISALTRARHIENLKEENLRAEEAICRLRITERNLKQAVEEARKANAIKSDFLARMSHELRTPLNAIIGYSEMLARELNQGATAGFANDAQRIRSAGQHLLTLINELLDLSKIEAGKTEIWGSEFRVNELTHDVADMIRPQIAENRNELHVHDAETDPLMNSDPVRLRQILFNLLANATKFTEAGDIHLEVESEDGGEVPMIRFRVRDNGIGMTAEQTRRVFDSFTQADDTISRRFGGTGLGLSVSRGLARLLGGDIAVESELGRGSVFTLTLPASMPTENEAGTEQRQIRSAPQDEHQESSGGGRILVVEDNAINRDMLTRHLELEGFETLSADDGPVAIDMARREQPDLILMDMSLPTMDGWETTRQLKNSAETRSIPVIGLSAHAMNSHRNKALDAGCDEYEHKPIDFEGLLQKIRRLKKA
ncbi:ATP-binding response regulator [Natronospira bacteriovora]|uniref:histidine kinase n=1 Tax=Natronospira bacteriovora TaxID=3069753 RepID=A0ABU0W4M2_9GAMM|nr:tetratricopeptide repeat protein [Natronospira sp. AB-CW4]MDQ2068410.1 tetratricopeptide repeat protein [Natronospira sp. AB-CW4]